MRLEKKSFSSRDKYGLLINYQKKKKIKNMSYS